MIDMPWKEQSITAWKYRGEAKKIRVEDDQKRKGEVRRKIEDHLERKRMEEKDLL